MSELKKGDLIKCKDADEAILIDTELMKLGYTTDYQYEGEDIFIEIIKGRKLLTDIERNVAYEEQSSEDN